MKRKLLTLGMALICVFSMTACSGEADTSANAESMYGITQDSAASYADQVIGSIQTIVVQGMQDQFGELMQNAALNTILGMGTVFVILILICLIIYCFNFIPKIQAAFSGKRKVPEDKREAAPAAAPAPVPAAPSPAAAQELVADGELVAVIAAAIAASEGAPSPEGFVVRSIRRVPASRWKANQ